MTNRKTTPCDDEASKHASNKTTTKMTDLNPHNDSITKRKRAGSLSSCGSGGATTVPECILHREKAAVTVSNLSLASPVRLLRRSGRIFLSMILMNHWMARVGYILIFKPLRRKKMMNLIYINLIYA